MSTVYRCDGCGRSYTYKKTYMRHLQTHLSCQVKKSELSVINPETGLNYEKSKNIQNPPEYSRKTAHNIPEKPSKNQTF